MALVELPCLILAKEGRPDIAGPEHPMRYVTRQLAFDPNGWTPGRAKKLVALFDSLAPTWASRDVPKRHDAVRDALERGGPFPSGPCLEVGAGTGSATADLQRHFDPLFSVDLSAEMLAMGHRWCHGFVPMQLCSRLPTIRSPLRPSSTCSSFRRRWHGSRDRMACCCG